MHSKRLSIFVGLLAVCFVALLPAYAQGEKTKVKGLITARTGDAIVLKATDGSSVNVTLDDDTVVLRVKPDNIKLQVARSAVSSLVPAEGKK